MSDMQSQLVTYFLEDLPHANNNDKQPLCSAFLVYRFVSSQSLPIISSIHLQNTCRTCFLSLLRANLGYSSELLLLRYDTIRYDISLSSQPGHHLCCLVSWNTSRIIPQLQLRTAAFQPKIARRTSGSWNVSIGLGVSH
jgi:hypothetical protein